MPKDRVTVHRSDLEKIHDVLQRAASHHVHRDNSNADLHLATLTRLSPLTSELCAARDRVTSLLTSFAER